MLVTAQYYHSCALCNRTCVAFRLLTFRPGGVLRSSDCKFGHVVITIIIILYFTFGTLTSCPSVTSRYPIDKTECRIMQFWPPGSPAIQIFRRNSIGQFTSKDLQWGCWMRLVGKIGDVQTLHCSISEMWKQWKIQPMVLLFTSSKSYTRFWLVPISMWKTLNDRMRHQLTILHRI